MTEKLLTGTLSLNTNKQTKATKKRWRHHFPHFKSMGVFCCHGHQSFDPICLKTLCSLSPPLVIPHIRFDQNWPTGFRDIQVRKCEFFRHSRASNSKVSSLIRPKIKLVRAFMLVLVTSNFDDDSIKMNELAWRHHYNIKLEMRSFKSNENIHKKEGGSYYVVSANKASSVTL